MKNTSNMFKALLGGGLILFLLVPIPVGQAAAQTSVSISNPGFEDFVLPDRFFTIPQDGRSLTFGIFDSNPIPGWTITVVPGRGSFEVEAGTFNPNSTRYPGEAPEGQNIAYSNGPTISQVLGRVLTANATYTLQVDVGRRLDLPSPGYVVSLLAGGTVLAQDVNTLTPAPGTFVTSTVTFNVPPGHPDLGKNLEIRLEPFSFAQGAVEQVNFDNVRLNDSIKKATLDLDPDVFEIEVDSDQEPEESEEEFLRAFIEPPAGVSAADIDVTTVTLSVNGTTLAAAEFPVMVGNVLDALFRLDPTNVSIILGLDVTEVEVDESSRKVEVTATSAPEQPIDLIELTVSGDLISGGSFSGTDAMRVIPEE